MTHPTASSRLNLARRRGFCLVGSFDLQAIQIELWAARCWLSSIALRRKDCHYWNNSRHEFESLGAGYTVEAKVGSGYMADTVLVADRGVTARELQRRGTAGSGNSW